MKKALWEKNIFELIRRTSTDLPVDVETRIKRALRREKKGSHAWWVLETILENTALARKNGVPICQDTGAMIFHVGTPVGFDTNALTAMTRAAVSKATRQGYLRKNTIDSVSGASYDTNVAHASPVFHFQEGARKTVDMRLVLKGGGSENIGCQFTLPDPNIKADRDLEGVRRCILNAVWQAQGAGCTPCVLGVCIGGDRASGYAHSKEQFIRKLGDKSSIKVLARMEDRIEKDVRKMGVGPMGLGGSSALLGVKISSLSRLPASYFVSVSFMCWAFRRRGVLLGPEGGISRWLY